MILLHRRNLTLHRGIGISLSVSSSVNKKNPLFKSGISRQDGEFLLNKVRAPYLLPCVLFP